ncbi:uncharacterized protein LOC143292827 isoform X2 [Babylonia areolata]
MVAFAGRPLFYQVSILLLFVATLMFCVGLALPWWTQTHNLITRTITGHSGLWITCSLFLDSGSSEEQCRTIDAPDWFKVVQGMQGAGLTGMLSSCAYAVVVNFCKDQITSSRAVQVLAGTGGLLGIISASVYVTKASTILKHSHGNSFSWAFSLDFAAAILVLFIAGFIALTNRPAVNGDDATTVIVQDCAGHEVKDTGSRSPQKPGRAGTGAAVKMERSPVRPRRLEAISEMFVSLDEEEEGEEGVAENPRCSASYVNSVGEVAHCDPSRDTS